jgi:hypothetical protein
MTSEPTKKAYRRKNSSSSFEFKLPRYLPTPALPTLTEIWKTRVLAGLALSNRLGQNDLAPWGGHHVRSDRLRIPAGSGRSEAPSGLAIGRDATRPEISVFYCDRRSRRNPSWFKVRFQPTGDLRCRLQRSYGPGHVRLEWLTMSRHVEPVSSERSACQRCPSASKYRQIGLTR